MDFFSHGLWAGAAYKALNKSFQKNQKPKNNKPKKPLNVWLAAFLGMLPDLFSFAFLFIWLAWALTFGGFNFSDLPHPNNMEPAPHDTLTIFRLTSFLYEMSHSLIIFILVFGLIFLILKRPVWEMGGWLLHILIDIPTHSYQFYPTPFLWPISDWKFNGLSWATSWFLIINYAVIIIVYILLRNKDKKE